MTFRESILIAPLLVATTLAGSALAQDATASTSAPTEAAATAPSPAEGYMSRYIPQNNLFEVGIFGGLFFPAKNHELGDPTQPLAPYAKVAPELGLRLAFFPLSFAGLEAEGAVMPTHTKRDDAKAGLWAVRGHVVAQLPLASIVPFVVVGGGALGTSSDTLGTDNDPAFHFGAGVKMPVDDFVSVRLDLRDTLAQKGNAKNGAQTHFPEALLGLTFTLDRSHPPPPPPPAPPDSDGDGIVDSADQCPTQAGPVPAGCPPPPDSDGDGVLDADDRCPTLAGPAPEGCPPPPDADKDGVPDPDDACPDVPGPAPKGCPLDPDNDGIEGDADQCPDQPETRNGFQDTDGCPDDLPEEVKQFTGVIPGIEFDFAKATIRPVSHQVLDGAAKILTDYPDLKVEISGHTDNVGQHDTNVKLSGARADSVKAYLVSKGIDAGRIQTRGVGPDEPLADNKTKANRQKNRRIEFKILTE
ncbi:MAG: OmpA family protein [Polyangiaceae bacterium]|nr:OmpA family protein [Polyangiaceae bacterium]